MTETEKMKLECACKMLEQLLIVELKKKEKSRMSETEMVDYVAGIVNELFDTITTP